MQGPSSDSRRKAPFSQFSPDLARALQKNTGFLRLSYGELQDLLHQNAGCNVSALHFLVPEAGEFRNHQGFVICFLLQRTRLQTMERVGH